MLVTELTPHPSKKSEKHVKTACPCVVPFVTCLKLQVAHTFGVAHTFTADALFQNNSLPLGEGAGAQVVKT